MHSLEIERRLRLPAPDEPRLLPSLVLPTSIGDYGKVRARTGFRPSSSRAGFLPQRLVLAMLALVVAMVAAIASGALRLENPFDSSRTFGARGVTLVYPGDWEVVAALTPSNDDGSWTTLIVSNTGVDGCSAADVSSETPPGPVPSGGEVDAGDQTGAIFGIEDRIFACVVATPMQAGEIRLMLLRGYPQRIGIGPIEPFDAQAWYGPGADFGTGAALFPTAENGWDQRIDGMPAKLVTETTSIVPGAEEVRTWGIYPPEGGMELWYIRSTLLGPDLDALRATADEIAQSVRFDTHPAPLDETTRDVALGRALDQVDRETREFDGSDLFGCFPRTAGSQAGTIDELLASGRPAGRLAEPVPVTCTTRLERGALEKWRATLTAAWDAGDGYAAGEFGWDITFDANGELGSGLRPLGTMDQAGQFNFPGSIGPLPSPLGGPVSLPIGTLAEVLPPGITFDSPALQAYNERPSDIIGDAVVSELPIGSIVVIVGGPLAHAGFDWYHVQLQHGASYYTGYPWVPVSVDDRPLLREIDPTCPAAPRIEDLAYLHPAARLACYGDEELTLDLASAELARDDGNMNEVDASPDWLASYSLWRLYGAGGRDGVDAPLPFAIAPALGDSIPTGTWLTVRGHFEDAAAAGCERSYPAEWGTQPVRELTVLECRQLFVVTNFEPRSAP